MSQSNERGHISEVKRNSRLAEYQIAQAESGIAKIQKAYESNSPFYTDEEATRRIAEYRDRILKVTRRKGDLEDSLQRITKDTESLEQTREALARLHIENVRNATFKEKVRVIEILDVKVYPSENMDHIGVTCAVNLAGLEGEGKLFSCHNTNMASPILIIPREFGDTQTYLEVSILLSISKLYKCSLCYQAEGSLKVRHALKEVNELNYNSSEFP